MYMEIPWLGRATVPPLLTVGMLHPESPWGFLIAFWCYGSHTLGVACPFSSLQTAWHRWPFHVPQQLEIQRSVTWFILFISAWTVHRSSSCFEQAFASSGQLAERKPSNDSLRRQLWRV